MNEADTEISALRKRLSELTNELVEANALCEHLREKTTKVKEGLCHSNARIAQLREYVKRSQSPYMPGPELGGELMRRHKDAVQTLERDDRAAKTVSL